MAPAGNTSTSGKACTAANSRPRNTNVSAPASAGEARRGFAVVGAEVKQLVAPRFGRDENDLQRDPWRAIGFGGLVSSLKTIQTSVTMISSSISQAATAVQQQSSATSEISARIPMA